MTTLKLRKEMFPMIYSGVKTSTSRQGVREIDTQQKLRFVMTEDESISTEVIVTNVKYCKFNELTQDEAVKEGYSSLKELQDKLSEIYDISKDDTFTIIEFITPYQS